MKKLDTYTVYGHCNLTNGKWYVGMTSQEPKKRFNYGFGYQNNSKMWKDIQNSDWNKDWIHTVFDKFNNKEDALDYESFLIGMFDCVSSGYNLSLYSSNLYVKTEETKKKISDSLTGDKHFFYNKHFSEEHKKKISDSLQKSPVIQYSKNGKFIAEYSSVMEASRKTNCSSGNICSCCKGTRKSTGGFIWKYKEAC